MRAVVLVGGFGTRLRPLTLGRPKQMLPIVGVTMLERVVGRLGEQGVTEVVLSLGFEPDQFRRAFPGGVCAGVPIHYAQEPTPLDTGGGIAFAARSAGIDDTFLALNGDVLTDLDIATLVAAHRASGAAGTIALTPVEDPSRYGVVDTDEDGRVRSFIEKPAPGTAPSNWINAGTYVLEPSVLDLVPPGAASSIERDVFPHLAAAGTLFAVGSEAYWVDAGTPDAYLQAQLDLVAGRRLGGPEPGVAPDAVVEAGASVERSVVGSGVRVGAGATVVDSVLSAGVRIGAGARVTGSIVGGDTVIGEGAVVEGLSVIGYGQAIAGGASLDGVLVPPKEEWA